MDNRELVVDLGLEGGSARVYRTPGEPGSWLFHVECRSIFLDDNLDEGWQDWSSGPLPTIQEAMQFISDDGMWVCFFPTKIHAEYRMTIWELVQEQIRELSIKGNTTWKRNRSHWESICVGMK